MNFKIRTKFDRMYMYLDNNYYEQKVRDEVISRKVDSNPGATRGTKSDEPLMDSLLLLILLLLLHCKTLL